MNASETTQDSGLTIDVTSAAIEDWRELASREGDGIEVRLLWSRSSNRVQVTVFDSKFDEEFVLDVASADALAAFHHPFAYAAGLGASFGDAGSRRGPLAPERSTVS